MLFYVHENMFLVDYAMHTFLFLVREHLNNTNKSANSEVLFKPDEILTILYHLLPQGQVILFNYEQVSILSKKVREFLDNKSDQYI